MQWLSGRVLDLRPRSRRLEPHPCHCFVSLSKNINPSLVMVHPRKTCPFITERLLMGRKESNQTNKQNSRAKPRETTEMSRDYHQLCPFSKWGLLLMERICSPVWEQIFSLKSSPLRKGKSPFQHYVIYFDWFQFSCA